MADWLMSVDDFIHEHLEVNEYKHYCEAIMDDSGNIGYAIPSHNLALLRLYGDYSPSEIMDPFINKEIYDKIPMNAGIVQWVCEDLNVVAIWYNIIILPIDYTIEQLETIATLMRRGIIHKDANIDVSIEKSLCAILDDPEKEDFNNKLSKIHEYKRDRLDEACIRLYTMLKE